MTWAEFQIRLSAYIRMQEREDLRAREIAYSSLWSYHSDPKKLPKTKDSFWKIGNNKPKPKLSEAHKTAFLKAMDQYKKDVENATNNDRN